MASGQVIGKCTAILARLKRGGEPEWDKNARGEDTQGEDTLYYGQVFAPLTDEQAVAVANYCADNMTWRPSRSELWDAVLTVVAPYPDDDMTYAEIVHKAATHGIVRPVEMMLVGGESKPVVRSSGFVLPEFSHPIVRAVVDMIGDWEAICTGEASYAEGLKKQVRAAHDSAVQRYRSTVMLKLRDGSFIERPYVPYELPGDRSADEIAAGLIEANEAQKMIEAEPERIEVTTMPKEVQKMIEALASAKAMPTGTRGKKA